MPLASSSGLLTSEAILITNEYLSNLILRDTKSRDWINVITLHFAKTFRQSMLDRKR